MAIMKASSGIDWIGFTWKGRRAIAELQSLYPPGLTKRGRQRKEGLLGYTTVWEFDDGRLECFHADRPDMGTHVIYTGDCLQYIYQTVGITPMDILRHCVEVGRVARLDICQDVLNVPIDFDMLIEQFAEGKAITKAKVVRRVQEILTTGDTIYVGSEKSAKRIRVYDKAAEQKLDWIVWTRIELQNRGKVANAVCHEIAMRGFDVRTIPELIRGFLDFPEVLEWSKAFPMPASPITVPRQRSTSVRIWLTQQVIPALAREVARGDGEEFYANFKRAVEELARDERQKWMDKDEWDEIPF